MQFFYITQAFTHKKQFYLQLPGIPLFMKLFIVLVVFSASIMHAAGAYSESTSVKLNVTDMSIENILIEIEKQTGCTFYYNTKDVDITKKVTLNSTRGDLSETLKQLFVGTNMDYIANGSNIVLRTKEVQQQQKYKITGTVVDNTGEPIIGASVSIKGQKNNGVITDIDGKFSLSVSSEKVILEVSYIGYKTTTVEVIRNKTVHIKLQEDNQMLDEVVVVGFGSQKKVNLTGAVATVSSDVFEGRPVQNATMSLQGAVPGLKIAKGTGKLDDAPSVSIRGKATIGEGSDGAPLILIDGMEGDLNMLNPQDIENVSVLKDAAASSIYGSRAPFGVILVTTKSGKNAKLSVNYNNSLRWSTPIRRPYMTDSYRFATYFNDAATNAKHNGHFSPERMQRIKDYQDGTISTVNIPSSGNPNVWADGYDYGNANVDWYDELYNTWTFAQEHTASMSGGNEKMQTYASMNYMGSDGMIKVSKDTYARYATNLKINTQMADYLNISYNLKYSRSDYDRPAKLGYLDQLGYRTWPTLPVYDDNGYLYDAPSPILPIRKGGRNKVRKDILSSQFQARIKPLEGWEIVGAVDYAINRERNHWDFQAYSNHNVAGDPIPSKMNTAVYEKSYSNDYWNFNVYTTYDKQLQTGHNFKVMAGFQSENSMNNGFSAKRNGIIVPGMDLIDVTNGTDGSGKATPPEVTGDGSEWGVIGFFGRLNYDYKERYLLEANLRHDGSSRFRAEKRWKTFPSVSLGWNVAKETFWEECVSYVNTFKIRGSYGVLGNQNTTSLYPTYPSMPIGTSDSSWLINGIKQNTANAPDLISTTLTWEMVKSLNVGFDVDAFNNRLSFSFNWYQRDTEDMVGPAPEMPSTLGIEVPKTNNTDLRTQGWEVDIRWRDRICQDFSYDIGFNLSDDRTTVTNYPDKDFKLDTYYSGKLLGQIWGYETIGIAKTKEEMSAHLATLPNGGQDAFGANWDAGDIMYKDLNGDGAINSGGKTINDHGDLKVLGNSNPRFRFGLHLGGSWKGLDASVLFQGTMRRDYWEGSWNFWGWTGYLWRSTAYEEHLDYFRNDPEHYMGKNLNSYYPRPLDGSTQNQKVQSRYLQNGAYIRLKNLQVGYTLPNTVTSLCGISKLRVFVSGENLWTGTKLNKIFDPEALGYGSGSIGYPLSQTFSAGISITL